jgi:hypothetical protein
LQFDLVTLPLENADHARRTESPRSLTHSRREARSVGAHEIIAVNLSNQETALVQGDER